MFGHFSSSYSSTATGFIHFILQEPHVPSSCWAGNGISYPLKALPWSETDGLQNNGEVDKLSKNMIFATESLSLSLMVNMPLLIPPCYSIQHTVRTVGTVFIYHYCSLDSWFISIAYNLSSFFVWETVGSLYDSSGKK